MWPVEPVESVEFLMAAETLLVEVDRKELDLGIPRVGSAHLLAFLDLLGHDACFRSSKNILSKCGE